VQCLVCEKPYLVDLVAEYRAQGMGYKEAWRALLDAGETLPRSAVQLHCAHGLSTSAWPPEKDGLKIHIVIPDTQVRPGVPTDHLGWIGSATRTSRSST